MCSQAGPPPRGPHPPAGDEVGGDDVALGENHVSPVQEGERGRVAGLRGSPASASVRAPAAWPSWVPLLPFLPAPAAAMPMAGCVWCPLRGADEAGWGGAASLPGPSLGLPQVKMQCRKGIPSSLRARCWPLLCGAHLCQENSPDTYQVRELAGVPVPFPGPLATPSPHTRSPTPTEAG